MGRRPQGSSYCLEMRNSDDRQCSTGWVGASGRTVRGTTASGTRGQCMASAGSTSPTVLVCRSTYRCTDWFLRIQTIDFEGEFRADKRHGNGKMTFQNGNRYEVPRFRSMFQIGIISSTRAHGRTASSMAWVSTGWQARECMMESGRCTFFRHSLSL